MSLYCLQCGADARPTYKFCPICGGEQFGAYKPAAQAAASQPVMRTPAAAPSPAPIAMPATGYTNAWADVSVIDVSGMSYASGGRRFFAALIDIVLTLVALAVLIAIFNTFSPDLTPVAMLPYAIATFWYYAATESGKHQATLGKRALRLVVAGMDGGRISGSRALGRNLLKGISTNIVLPLLLFFFTERRQALHDLWGGTVVMYRGK